MFGLALGWLAAFQLFKLPVVLPVLLENYAYDRALAGAFMSVYAIAGLALSVWLGRHFSAKQPFGALWCALTLFAAGNATMLIAPRAGLLVLGGRAVEGVGFAILAIAGPVLANAHASPRQLPLVIGVTATWIPAGQIAATVLAPGALAVGGWRAMWYAALLATAAMALWCLRLDARPAAVAPAPPARNADHLSRVDERRNLALAAAVFMLWACQYFAYMTWLPQYLVDVYAMTAGAAMGGYVVPVALVLMFNLVTGLALRRGVRPAWLMSAALVAQCAVWWAMPLTHTVAGGIVSLAAYGIAAGIVPTCLFAMPHAIVAGTRHTAGAFGVIMTGRNLGVLVGPIALAEAFKLSGNWQLAAPVFGTLTSLAALIALGLAWRIHALRAA